MELVKPVIKQMLVNQISLPYDILYIIKEFAFENPITVRSKYCKNMVDNVIKNALCSSVNIMHNEDQEEEEDQEGILVDNDYDYGVNNHYQIEERQTCVWTFCGEETDFQFQCVFCVMCGDYIIHNDSEFTRYDNIPFTDKILCKCVHE